MNSQELLLTIYKNDEHELIQIKEELQKTELSLTIEEYHESAAIGELAGAALKVVIDTLNSDSIEAAGNFLTVLSIGRYLYNLLKKQQQKGKTVTVHSKGIEYIALHQNRELFENDLSSIEVVGPYDIQNPNSELQKLVSVSIPGKIPLNGTFIGFKHKNSTNDFLVYWKLYSNKMEEVLAWETVVHQDGR